MKLRPQGEAGGIGCGVSGRRVEQEAGRVLTWLAIEAFAGRGTAGLAYPKQRRVVFARALAMSPKYFLLNQRATQMSEAESADLGFQRRMS